MTRITSPARTLATHLRKKHRLTISRVTAHRLAGVHGLRVAREGKKWWLFRSNGMGHPLYYSTLVELINDLVL